MAFSRPSLIAPLLLAPLILDLTAATRVQAQANDMFPTKAAALQRARQLKCAGAFAMGSQWMPCRAWTPTRRLRARALELRVNRGLNAPILS